MSRAQAIAALRQHARDEAKRVGPAAAHRDLLKAVSAILEDFRAEHDVPGVRYWETYYDTTEPPYWGSWFTTFVSGYDPFAIEQNRVTVELNRLEFFARQGAQGYDDLL